ncbi:MAG: M28 family peptidase [Candidatus Lokiarchaeota archaeon]|nr:M28 family peptidase [Candidatus Lokiarchaeota archaeon]
METDKKIHNQLRNFISEICNEIGPRVPCSDNERKTAELLMEKLRKHTQYVQIEDFTTHRGAYKAAFRIPMILYITIVITYWTIPLVNMIISLISFIILFGEMAMAFEIIDFLFPKKMSQNLITKMVLKSNQEVLGAGDRSLVIIGSHIDSNWEFPLFRKIGILSTIVIAINVIFQALLLINLILKNILIGYNKAEILHEFDRVFYWILVIGIIPAVVQLFFIISNRPVMGANDNLSGVAVCYELIKYFSQSGTCLDNIELWVCFYGCEEIGSKGSKAFIKKHYREIKNAIVVNVDMVGNTGSKLIIDTSEVFGTVKMDKNLIEMIEDTARNLDIPIKKGAATAFTDSMSFARNGIKCVSLVSLPVSSKKFYYHTREDTLDNMDFTNLMHSRNLLIKVLTNLDKDLDSDLDK